MSVRLTHALKAGSFPVVCLDARHAQAVLRLGAAPQILPALSCCGNPRQAAVE